MLFSWNLNTLGFCVEFPWFGILFFQNIDEFFLSSSPKHTCVLQFTWLRAFALYIFPCSKIGRDCRFIWNFHEIEFIHKNALNFLCRWPNKNSLRIPKMKKIFIGRKHSHFNGFSLHIEFEQWIQIKLISFLLFEHFIHLVELSMAVVYSEI